MMTRWQCDKHPKHLRMATATREVGEPLVLHEADSASYILPINGKRSNECRCLPPSPRACLVVAGARVATDAAALADAECAARRDKAGELAPELGVGHSGRARVPAA